MSDKYKWFTLDIDGVCNSERSALQYPDGRWGWPPRYLYKPDDDDCYEGYGVAQCRFDPVAIGILRRMVETYEAKIVISSTWRQHSKLADFHFMFDLYGWDTREIILDMTPVRSTGSLHRQYGRGYEIEFWRQKNEHRIEDYIILDDSHDMTAPQIDGGHFQPVNMLTGLDINDWNFVAERWGSKRVTNHA